MKTIVFTSGTPEAPASAVAEINERIFHSNQRVTTPQGENLLIRLVESFKDSSLLFLRWIRDARENGDTANLEQSLRMLRNSAVLIGALRLSKLASDYLRGLHEGQPFTREDVDTLAQGCMSFSRAADEYIAENVHS